MIRNLLFKVIFCDTGRIVLPNKEYVARKSYFSNNIVYWDAGRPFSGKLVADYFVSDKQCNTKHVMTWALQMMLSLPLVPLTAYMFDLDVNTLVRIVMLGIYISYLKRWIYGD